ncbi:MAG: SMP-30/gluconolactonase/LRE family protein [Candidatus Aminicenantales bacterium]
MRTRVEKAAAALGLVSALGLLPGPLLAKKPRTYPTAGQVARIDERLDSLISPDARIEVLAMGFDWVEGPLWVPDEKGGFLLFSNIPANAVMQWREDPGVGLFLKPSGFTGIVDYGREPGSNGLALDAAGRIIFCEQGDRRVSLLLPDGGKVTLADRYEGKRFNSPNDAVVKSNGDIYFTDPPYGLPKRGQDPRRELDFCGVYRISKSGGLTLCVRDLANPNGLAFSPDESVLYVSQSGSPTKAVIMAYPVLEDGTLGPGRVFYDFSAQAGRLPGGPDGMKVDGQGNLFASGPGGISVITPRGELLGRIETGQVTANCAWGDDGATLYLTADTMICRIRTKTRGANWK